MICWPKLAEEFLSLRLLGGLPVARRLPYPDGICQKLPMFVFSDAKITVFGSNSSVIPRALASSYNSGLLILRGADLVLAQKQLKVLCSVPK